MSEPLNNNAIIQFQSDVLNGRDSAVRAFMQALAQEFTNRHLQAIAEEHTLIHWQRAEDFDGNRVILARDFARLCYGTDNTSNLNELFQSHQIDFYRLTGSNGHPWRLKEHFGLAKNTSQINFVSWDHLMVAAAHGQTTFAVKLWNRILGVFLYGAADQESRRQTGQGFVENAERQLKEQSRADLYENATKEVNAYAALLRLMGYSEAHAIMQGVREAQRVTGLDLSQEINNSPLMRDVPDEETYLPVSVLEKRFQIPVLGGTPGHHFNVLLERYGLQTQEPDRSWQPTARAIEERYCSRTRETNRAWQGFIWRWRIDLGARIAQWYKRTQQDGAQGA